MIMERPTSVLKERPSKAFSTSWRKKTVEPGRFEGVLTGDYAREKLEVSINGDGKAHGIHRPQTGPENPPTREYLDHLLAGEEYLSPHYLEKLRRRSTLDS